MNERTVTRRVWMACVVAPLLFAATAVWAADTVLDCVACHDDVAVASPAHSDGDCQSCHTNVVERRHRARDLVDLSGDAICAQCHRLANKSVARSVHADGAACQDCHGPAHLIRKVDDLEAQVSPFRQVETCGRCHNEPAGLIDGYIDSVHGRGLLRSGLINAPSCSDCHGDHRILETGNERAATSHKNSPDMCGACHVGVLQTWKRESAHGKAWQEGNTEGPVCTDCHESHTIQDPVNAGARRNMPSECGNCHGALYSSYRGSFHGKFTRLGLVSSATCSDCHTPHANRSSDDPNSSIHPDKRAETCGACHTGMSAAFFDIDPHNDPSDPSDNAYVYYVYMFMMALLIGVFAFFGLHDLLWLQRSFVGALRGEFASRKRPGRGGQYVRRFPGVYILMHIVIIVTFLLLALTGLPLKFDSAPWAQTMIDLLGGLEAARVIHRMAAVGTFGYMVFHLIHLAIRITLKHERGLFWGPDSMVPQWQDVKDLVVNVRHFLYLGPPLKGGRWTYWEKFDYLAVFWGVMIIGLSGLMLWFPGFFTRFLPGWAINAAFVVHSDEALLATGFIFVFHFFHTHLRPESFPMDPVVFTGRMPLEKFKQERPKEYQSMLERGTLEQNLEVAPTREEMIWVYAFGFFALSVGLALAAGIFWALLVH